MRPQDSQAEYQRRIHRVLAYIDQHLDEDLSLEVLADVAHFSRFHFHRVFVALCGETLGDYLRRRRVEVAATRLVVHPQFSVLTVALGVGFGSGEAFTRAFKARFGMSPSAWRASAKSNPGQVNSNLGQVRELEPGEYALRVQPSDLQRAMKVDIRHLSPVNIAYLRRTGAYGPGVSQFWQETVYPWMVQSQLLGRARYGISLDDPAVTAPDKCRYDACVEVPAGFKATGDALCTELPGGPYAVHAFNGTVTQLVEAWAQLFTHWLPASGKQLDARPLFEHYPVTAGYDAEAGTFECELCIPVAPL